MTQNQLIDLFESEHVKALIERAEEHGGQLEAPELEAFVLEHDIGEEDAELLKSDIWREKVSTSIVTAIDNYFSHQLARLPM